MTKIVVRNLPAKFSDSEFRCLVDPQAKVNYIRYFPGDRRSFGFLGLGEDPRAVIAQLKKMGFNADLAPVQKLPRKQPDTELLEIEQDQGFLDFLEKRKSGTKPVQEIDLIERLRIAAESQGEIRRKMKIQKAPKVIAENTSIEPVIEKPKSVKQRRKPKGSKSKATLIGAEIS